MTLGGRRSNDTFLNSRDLAATLGAIVIVLAAAALVTTGVISLPTPPTPPVSALSSPTPVPTPSGPTPEPTFAEPTPSPEPTFVSYVVKSGDTLTSIAKKYRTTARSIAWWNRGTHPSLDPESANYDPNNIKLGWVLVLIPGRVVDDSNPPTPSPPPTRPLSGPSASP
jgi:LysM repeat protein